MKLKELLAKRAALLKEVEEADEKRFAEIKAAIEKLDYQIDQEQRAVAAANETAEKERLEAEQRAARPPAKPGDKPGQAEIFRLAFGGGAGNEERKAEVQSKIEERGEKLKKGEAVTYETRALLSSNTAMPVAASAELSPAYEQVGTLDGLVKNKTLIGANANKVGYVKNYGTGAITEEGKAAADAEPSFGYVDINRVKITAYAELSEEAAVLPPADYDGAVGEAVIGAVRRKIISQILAGNGNKELVGIFNTPAEMTDGKQKKVIATINENTLDDFIYDYGGDENVEGDAAILMNKLTLKEFAKVKGSDKRKAYDIVLNGNTGTINGIPFVLSSNIKPYATAGADVPYMAYGKLGGYELDYFSNMEVRRSADYKFKEGMVAYKVTVWVGGAPIAFNAFMTICKSTAVSPTNSASDNKTGGAGV